MFKYNPFKWHVVQLPDGKYAVRKRVRWLPFMSVYADADFDGYVWCTRDYARTYAYVAGIDKAIKLAKFMNKTKVVWAE